MSISYMPLKNIHLQPLIASTGGTHPIPPGAEVGSQRKSYVTSFVRSPRLGRRRRRLRRLRRWTPLLGRSSHLGDGSWGAGDVLEITSPPKKRRICGGNLKKYAPKMWWGRMLNDQSLRWATATRKCCNCCWARLRTSACKEVYNNFWIFNTSLMPRRYTSL